MGVGAPKFKEMLDALYPPKVPVPVRWLDRVKPSIDDIVVTVDDKELIACKTLLQIAADDSMPPNEMKLVSGDQVLTVTNIGVSPKEPTGFAKAQQERKKKAYWT